jgi:hypothetical protein
MQYTIYDVCVCVGCSHWNWVVCVLLWFIMVIWFCTKYEMV